MDHGSLIEKLELVGFDEAEAGVYLELLEVGPAKVTALNEHVDTSRSTLYRILDRLSEAGYVAKSLGQPTRYQAREPRRAFEQHRKELDREKERLAQVEEELVDPLTQLQGRGSSSQEHHWQRLEGPVPIYEVVERVLAKAERSIDAASNHPACFRTDIPHIERAWSAFGSRAREGLRTRVLLDATDRSVEAFDPLVPTDAIDFRSFQRERLLHFIVVDDEETIVWARMPPDVEAEGPEPVALWTTAPAIVANQRELFEALWAQADRIAEAEPAQR